MINLACHLDTFFVDGMVDLNKLFNLVSPMQDSADKWLLHMSKVIGQPIIVQHRNNIACIDVNVAMRLLLGSHKKVALYGSIFGRSR